MSLPGFSAHASLTRSDRLYRMVGSHPLQGGRVAPAMTDLILIDPYTIESYTVVDTGFDPQEYCKGLLKCCQEGPDLDCCLKYKRECQF